MKFIYNNLVLCYAIMDSKEQKHALSRGWIACSSRCNLYKKEQKWLI